MSIRKMNLDKIQPSLLTEKARKKKIPALKSLSSLTPFEYRSPLLSPNIDLTPQKKTINNLISDKKCSEMQQKLQKTREALLKEIQDTLNPHDKRPEKVFHKSSKFIQRKIRIKENVKQSKYKSSAKLFKIKSIIDSNEKSDIGKEFLVEEDLQNGEATEFLNMNKRKFGESKQGVSVFREKKKKSPANERLSNTPKLNSRTSSLPELTSPKVTPTSLQKQLTITERKSLEKRVSTPVNNYIMSEMKKLWPPDTAAISEKKRKILKVKIDKLQSIIEEKSSNLLENELIYGKKRPDDQFKLDMLIHQHLRTLRKKLTIDKF